MATRIDGRLEQDSVVLSVRRYYAGRTVLITGATGFLGNALVEKFVRDLGDVRRLYILVRPRPDRSGRVASPGERLERDVLASSVFDTLRARLGHDFRNVIDERLTAVGGDVEQPGLGLDDDVRERLRDELDVIINVAADVTFDAPLDRALRTNTLGAAHVLDFSGTCRNRVILAHVSTCYVSGRRAGEIPELPLDPAFAPSGAHYDVDTEIADIQRVIANVERAGAGAPRLGRDADVRRAWSDARLRRIGMQRARRLGWNDVYTYTKAMGEQLLARRAGATPVVIVRPSIIESALNEPMPGWIDHVRMADPIIVGYGRFQLRDFPGNAEQPLDIVPVDMVVNALLTAVPYHDEHDGPNVFQVASGAVNPVTQREFVWYVREALEHESLTGRPRRRELPVFTFPSLTDYERRVRWLRLLPTVLLQRAAQLASFTALGRDTAQRARGRRLALEKQLHHANLIAPYSMLECRFRGDNVQRMWSLLSARERHDFRFDVGTIDWRDYIRHVHVPGLQKFVLGMDRTPQARTPATVERARRATPPALPTSGPIARVVQSSTRAVFGIILRRHLRMTYDGLEHVEGAAPFIAVSNHSSHADAAALMVLLNRPGRTVRPVAARDYFFHTPFAAWASRTFLDAVPFERHAPSAASLALAVSLLRRGESLICFPEGGRSVDGSLGEFKRGAALMALEAGVPLIPVRITGSFDALPRGSWLPRRRAIHVRFGQPISTYPYLTHGSTGSLTERARSLTAEVRRAVEQLA